LLRRAGQFIERLMDARDTATALASIDEVLADFGIDYFSFQDLPESGRPYSDFVFCKRIPQEWFKLYNEEEYVAIDPAFRFCRRVTTPFIWADAPFDAELEPHIAQFVNRVHDFGLAHGIMIPVPRSNDRPGVVWFGGERAELTRSTGPVLHLLSLYAFEQLRSLSRGFDDRVRPLLTSREREVLAWAAEGKSAWEIGEILNITKRTVEEHVQLACRKLGAGNRTHAVALAIRKRLLEP
jgi:LuxR family transcriptional regulator, quorum-sensing system regulator BjaR1